MRSGTYLEGSILRSSPDRHDRDCQDKDYEVTDSILGWATAEVVCGSTPFFRSSLTILVREPFEGSSASEPDKQMNWSNNAERRGLYAGW